MGLWGCLIKAFSSYFCCSIFTYSSSLNFLSSLYLFYSFNFLTNFNAYSCFSLSVFIVTATFSNLLLLLIMRLWFYVLLISSSLWSSFLSCSINYSLFFWAYLNISWFCYFCSGDFWGVLFSRGDVCLWADFLLIVFLCDVPGDLGVLRSPADCFTLVAAFLILMPALFSMASSALSRNINKLRWDSLYFFSMSSRASAATFFVNAELSWFCL